MKKWLPWLLVAVFGGEALIMALVLVNAKPKPGVFDFAGFGKVMRALTEPLRRTATLPADVPAVS